MNLSDCFENSCSRCATSCLNCGAKTGELAVNGYFKTVYGKSAFPPPEAPMGSAQARTGEVASTVMAPEDYIDWNQSKLSNTFSLMLDWGTWEKYVLNTEQLVRKHENEIKLKKEELKKADPEAKEDIQEEINELEDDLKYRPSKSEIQKAEQKLAKMRPEVMAAMKEVLKNPPQNGLLKVPSNLLYDFQLAMLIKIMPPEQWASLAEKPKGFRNRAANVLKGTKNIGEDERLGVIQSLAANSGPFRQTVIKCAAEFGDETLREQAKNLPGLFSLSRCRSALDSALDSESDPALDSESDSETDGHLHHE